MKTMQQHRNDAHEALQKFTRAFNRYPHHLFASPDWAKDVSIAFAKEQMQESKPIHGLQFCSMMIHVVPTLDGTFFIA
jgi:hypothetical protein